MVKGFRASANSSYSQAPCANDAALLRMVYTIKRRMFSGSRGRLHSGRPGNMYIS